MSASNAQNFAKTESLLTRKRLNIVTKKDETVVTGGTGGFFTQQRVVFNADPVYVRDSIDKGRQNTLRCLAESLIRSWIVLARNDIYKTQN